MKSNSKNIIAITIAASSILLIIGSSGFQDSNAYMCDQSIAVCSQPHKLITGIWDFYAAGNDGFLNITSSKDMDNFVGTLQLSNASGAIQLCPVSQPCNIKGTFDTQTGKINFTSTPSIPTFIADIQNYVGYESFKVSGVDVVQHKLDGIGTVVSPPPVKEFGWEASKSCLVIGPCLGR